MCQGGPKEKKCRKKSKYQVRGYRSNANTSFPSNRRHVQLARGLWNQIESYPAAVVSASVSTPVNIQPNKKLYAQHLILATVFFPGCARSTRLDPHPELVPGSRGDRLRILPYRPSADPSLSPFPPLLFTRDWDGHKSSASTCPPGQ